MAKPIRSFGVAVWAACLTVALATPLLAQHTFKTGRTVVFYHSAEDLLEMDRGLKDMRVSARPGLSLEGSSQDPAGRRLAGKIDGLFDRVCQILRLWPKNHLPLKIFLLKNGREVRERHLVFQPFATSSFFFGQRPLEAFFEAHSRAVFLSLADVDPGILAHEMTHFLLCTAVPVPPPRNLQEDWARYVEIRVRRGF
jgi:hypothetical protein